MYTRTIIIVCLYMLSNELLSYVCKSYRTYYYRTCVDAIERMIIVNVYMPSPSMIIIRVYKLSNVLLLTCVQAIERIIIDVCTCYRTYDYRTYVTAIERIIIVLVYKLSNVLLSYVCKSYRTCLPAIERNNNNNNN